MWSIFLERVFKYSQNDNFEDKSFEKAFVWKWRKREDKCTCRGPPVFNPLRAKPKNGQTYYIWPIYEVGALKVKHERHMVRLVI